RRVSTERADHSRIVAERGRRGFVERPYSYHGTSTTAAPSTITATFTIATTAAPSITAFRCVCTRRITITRLDFTAGPIIRGGRAWSTPGDGEDVRGTATTAITLHRTPSMRAAPRGSPTT